MYYVFSNTMAKFNVICHIKLGKQKSDMKRL